MAKTDDEIERDFAALCALFEWALAERDDEGPKKQRRIWRGLQAAEVAIRADGRIRRAGAERRGGSNG